MDPQLQATMGQLRDAAVDAEALLAEGRALRERIDAIRVELGDAYDMAGSLGDDVERLVDDQSHIEDAHALVGRVGAAFAEFCRIAGIE